MPEIHPVTKENWRELADLQVGEAQKDFVISNAYSIIESKYGYDHPHDGHWDMVPYGIYDGKTPVGFLMLGYNFSHPTNQGYIVRLMIAEKFQGKGHAKFALHWILAHYRADSRVKTVGLDYLPENRVARKLYASLGFAETGELSDEGHVVAAINL